MDSSLEVSATSDKYNEEVEPNDELYIATVAIHNTMQSYSFCTILLVRKHISVSRKYLEGERGNYFQQIHGQHRCRFPTWNYRDSSQLLVYNYSHYIVKSISYKCIVTY